jgi:hypothetical protein
VALLRAIATRYATSGNAANGMSIVSRRRWRL